MINDEAFESKKELKKRLNNFGTFCQNLFDNARIDILKPLIEKMSNYYVPIDCTNLYKYVPERDKILYSTLCRVTNRRPGGRHDIVERWTPHVLITRTGLALFHKKKNRPIFNSWYQIPKIVIKDPHRIKINGLPGVWKHSRTFFSIEKKALDNRYETLESLKERSKYFANYCSMVKDAYSIQHRELWNYTNHTREKFARDGITEFLDKIVPFIYTGFYQKGLEVLNEVLKVIPEEESDVFWYYKGEALRLLFKDEEALDSYEMAFKINPQNTRANDKRYEMRLKINIDSIPLKEYKKARKMSNKGQKKLKKESHTEALEFFNESLKLNPYDTTTLYNKGLNLEALGRPEEAKECYQEILKINPKDSLAAEQLRSL